MLTIYYLPGTAAMAPHAALEETGAEFEAVEAVRDADRNAVAPPGFVAISPFGASRRSATVTSPSTRRRRS